MADLQRIDVSPVPVDMPLQASPLPAAAAAASERMSNTIGTLTAQAVDWLDKTSAENAQKDAAQLVDDVGKGVVPPPSSFDPPGFINTRSYATNFKSTAEALYFQQSSDAFSAYGDQMRAKYPLEPAKVAEEMDKKRTELLGVMGAEYKPYMSVRFNGIQAQHVANTQTARANDNRQQIGVQAQRALDGWTNQIATSARWAGRLDTATANSTAAFHNDVFTKEVEPQLRAAGKTNEDIANIKQESIDRAQIFRIQQSFADTGGLMITAAGQWVVDPAKVAEWNEQINHMFAGEPKMMEKRAAARAGLQDAAAIASGKAQGAQIRQTAEVQTQVLAAAEAAMQARLRNLQAGKVDAATAEQQKLDYMNTVLRTMTRNDLSAANKMAVVGGMDHAWGGLNQSNQEFFQTQALKVTSAATSLGNEPGAQQKRDEGRQQLDQIINNPQLMSVMTPAIQAHVLSARDTVTRRRAAADWQVGWSDMQDGRLSAPAVNDMRETGYRNGTISADGYGIATPTEFEKMAQHNHAMAELRSQQDGVLSQAFKNLHNRQPLSPTQREAINNAVPFVGGPGAFTSNGNIATPEGMAALGSYLATYHTMPPSALKQLNEAGFLGGDPKAAQMYLEAYQHTVNAVSTGTDMVSQAGAEANAETLMGERAARIGRTVQQAGVEKAADYFKANSTGSNSRNAGESEAGAGQKFEKVSTTALAKINDAINENPVTRGVSGLIGGGPTQNEKTFLGMTDPKALPDIAGSVLGLHAKTSGIRIADPAIRATIEGHYLQTIQTYGSIDSALAGDKQQQAYMTAIAKNSDKYEFAADPEVQGGLVLQYKGTRQLAAQVLGMEPGKLPDADARNLWAGASQRMIDSGYVKVPDNINPEMIRWEETEARLYRTATGRMRVQVAAPVGGTYSNAGAAVPLYDIDSEDPLLTGLGANITRHAAEVGRMVREEQRANVAMFREPLAGGAEVPVTSAKMMGYAIAHTLEGGYAIYNGLLSELQYGARVRQEIQAGGNRPSALYSPWSFATDLARRLQSGDASTVLHSDATAGAIPETVQAYRAQALQKKADMDAHLKVLDEIRERRRALLNTAPLSVTGAGR